MATQTLAKIRFGYGLKPGEPAIQEPEALLAEILDPPARAAIATIGPRLDLLRRHGAARKAEKNGGDAMGAKTLRQRLGQQRLQDARAAISRPIGSAAGFQERVFAFWADHFTVSAKNMRLAAVLPAFWDEAIRPHLAGRFADMLGAVATHPAMLVYLDQAGSVGPNSRAGRRRGRGLNENLAREMLELHALGVGSGYSQGDVTQLAELLTGLTVNADGFRFNPGMAEPGAEVILGRSYGGARARLSDIHLALEDLAMRPETAHHLARKLAAHFVADQPDAALVARMADAYLAADGALPALYRALVTDAAAWVPGPQKVKPPLDFMISAFRAFGADDIHDLPAKEIRRRVFQPLIAMGQPLFKPPGPDGWPGDAAAWITPALLAARIEWAGWAARSHAGDIDPRHFVATALGGGASAPLRFAARAAESKWEGVALILASPEFNRR